MWLFHVVAAAEQACWQQKKCLPPSQPPIHCLSAIHTRARWSHGPWRSPINQLNIDAIAGLSAQPSAKRLMRKTVIGDCDSIRATCAQVASGKGAPTRPIKKKNTKYELACLLTRAQHVVLPLVWLQAEAAGFVYAVRDIPPPICLWLHRLRKESGERWDNRWICWFNCSSSFCIWTGGNCTLCHPQALNKALSS